MSTVHEPLSSLIRALDGYVAYSIPLIGQKGNPPGIMITGLEYDSRHIQPGNCFVALSGGNTDGHLFILDAIRRGAGAVVGEYPLADLDVPFIQVENSRLALAYLSAAFYAYPARQMTMIGVTGTDGKTTTSTLIYNILREAGYQAGLVSTVNAVIGGQMLDTGFHVTTPEAPEVQKYLAQMLSAGHTHVVLEATSHGLHQHRVTACEFDVGVITNITHEHLDYHGSFQAYREAKGRLFSGLFRTLPKAHGVSPAAILNLDDPSYEYLIGVIADQEKVQHRKINLITYGLQAEADVTAEEITYHPRGSRFTAVFRGLRLPIQAHLIGEYNIANCLAAIAATMGGLNIGAPAVQRGIDQMEAIPGRMEGIDMGQKFFAIVDFAHTPNALQKALQAALKMVIQSRSAGRVIAIFGSAGLRDRAKRRMMAEISVQLADFTILTAEDPRTESLASILDEMARGAESMGGVEGKSFWRIPDRREAIRFGVKIARPGDLVIALGKGHEQSMCFGEIEYPWDDRVAMRAVLAELLNIPGPEMPFLPALSGG